MKEQNFRDLLIELIDENPFAIRATLKILHTEFTEKVSTLSVTCEDRPRLLVNLSFVSLNCKTDDHVKALICHEFLHVLLRHTEQKKRLTQASHLAFDAVINAIIHRQYGSDYSGVMSHYYADSRDLCKLLRPMNAKETRWYAEHAHQLGLIPQWVSAWNGLYCGKLVADDIESLAESLSKASRRGEKSAATSAGPFILEGGIPGVLDSYLGNHNELGQPLSSEISVALDQSMREMNGAGVWRLPKGRGVGANAYEALFNAQNEPMIKWERKTLAILREHLSPDRKSRSVIQEDRIYRIPILSPSDRRAYMRSLWNPFLPDATWTTRLPKRQGSAFVYLDVSGSMNAEMPKIIALLGRLSRYIRRPFWAFSDEVVPAVIERGQLKAETTGGTSMACVIDHLALTQPYAAIVVTDGYIEKLDKQLVRKIGKSKLHVVLTRDGSAVELKKAGLSYTQLDKVPS